MKILLSIILTTLITLCNAQDLVLNESELVISASDFPYYGDIILTNTGSENLDIGITVEPVCYMEGDSTSLFICSTIICLGTITSTSTFGDDNNPFMTLTPGDSFDEITIFPERMVDGIGTEWNLIYFEIGNPENHATITIKTEGECGKLTGTQDLVEIEETAYPCPAVDFISIPYSEFSEATNCNIYNSIGELVESIRINHDSKNILLSLSGYAEGGYFYQLYNQEKTSVARPFLKL